MTHEDLIRFEAYVKAHNPIWHEQIVANLKIKPDTSHLCPFMCLAPGEFSGGKQVKCNGKKIAGLVFFGCNEPCNFVMDP